MTVVLSTDYANSYRGFSAQYTSAPLPGPAEPDSEYPSHANRMLLRVLTCGAALTNIELTADTEDLSLFIGR